MGLDLGFEKSGFDIRVACEIRKEVCDTIAANRPDIPVLQGDITTFDTKQILKKARLAVGETTAVIGGPACQPFSTAGVRKSFNEKRGMVLFEYIRVVREARPQFFVFENVTGFTNAALKHMSFYERIKKKENEIEQQSRLGTVFKYALQKLEETGYTISYNVLNAADYGVPQNRHRLIIIGSRDGIKINFPEPTHAQPKSSAVKNGDKNAWLTLQHALKGLKEKEQEHVKFPSWGKYMKYVKPGGCWRDIPKALQKKAMNGAYYSSGGRTGYFRRLKWNAPSPTLVTLPVFKSTCLAHPKFNRPLSVQEYARIQGFPDDWKFCGTLKQRYRMIGEAVPIQLASAISLAIRSNTVKLLKVEEHHYRNRTYSR
jgi:DNA (cytosine-5)-methyltransferase 1